MAGKKRILVALPYIADLGVLVEITESAGIAADIGTSDRASRAGVEVDGAAGRIIAEHRRGGPAEDVDRAVGVRVRQIGARQTVRLGHRKSVFEHLDIADAEAVSGVRAAYRYPDIARSVALLDRDPRALAQNIADRKCRLVLELRTGDCRDRLPGGLGLDVKGRDWRRGRSGDDDGG